MKEAKCVDTVVICASGKGTRLYPLTAHIPKILVNPDNFNVLTHIVKYWEPYTENIVVIVEEAYHTITDYYLKQLNVVYKIIDVNITTQGNAYTLYNALKNDYDHKKVLITWCDIYPSSPIPQTVFNANVIFTYGNQCRYKYSNNTIEEAEKADGNIIGIYYFNDYVSMKYGDESDDIINVMPRYHTSFDAYDILQMDDVGDMDKLIAYENKNKSEYETRYYNKITEVG